MSAGGRTLCVQAVGSQVGHAGTREGLDSTAQQSSQILNPPSFSHQPALLPCCDSPLAHPAHLQRRDVVWPALHARLLAARQL